MSTTPESNRYFDWVTSITTVTEDDIAHADESMRTAAQNLIDGMVELTGDKVGVLTVNVYDNDDDEVQFATVDGDGFEHFTDFKSPYAINESFDEDWGADTTAAVHWLSGFLFRSTRSEYRQRAGYAIVELEISPADNRSEFRSISWLVLRGSIDPFETNWTRPGWNLYSSEQSAGIDYIRSILF